MIKKLRDVVLTVCIAVYVYMYVGSRRMEYVEVKQHVQGKQ